MANVPQNINKQHILEAIKKIDREGIEKGSQSSTYDLLYEGNRYPPKLVTSWANEYANGEMLDRQSFDGGLKSACFRLLRKEGFEIVEKEVNIYSVVEQFINDSKSGNLKTKHYPKSYKGLKVKVSFGQGAHAKVPWMAFLKDGEEVQKGIYPVFLFYKTLNCLVLSYGVSKTNKPDSSWNIEGKQTTSDYLEKTYGTYDETYSESFICSAYDTDKPLDSEKLSSDLSRIFKDYELANFALSVTNINEPNSLYNVDENKTSPLNQILFGPPGTGKTYYSIQAAVKAAEPEKYAEIGINKKTGATPSQRESLNRLYKDLFEEGRIRFVTFHQSYGYEEFVEGLSAKTEGEQLTYFEKDGLFKELCTEAKKHLISSTESKSASFEDKWNAFSEELAESEYGIKIDTLSKKTHFTVTDVTNNTIRFDKSKGDSVHSLSVKTLQAVHNGEKVIKGGLQPYYGAVIEYLNKLLVHTDTSPIDRKNYVLIIDEINRGNISKIFGELITLIEPSKRLGQAESIEVSLPYSGDKFSVPDNLYIIGTMNTADRSLALMDTALRRRFDFIEMMPDYNALNRQEGESYIIEHQGHQINLSRLLQTINKRISALYDREHQLGHAFLMPVVNAIRLEQPEKAIEELRNCFQNKIIPLLAEYFFEDWQKIRLVLGDNQKPNQYQLIEQLDTDFQSLFGDNDDTDDYVEEEQHFNLIASESEIWNDALVYIGIYDTNELPRS